MDTIDLIPDHLKCPICMEVPQNKVLQCREGHYLCEACYSKISNCPQCRIPFNNEKIRNLHVEMMLDKLSWACPYQKNGCTRTISRRSNLDHVEKCFYNTKRFGPLVTVCKMIGFHNCPFKVNKGNTFQFIHHLKNYHWVTSRTVNSMELEFTNYENFFGGTKHFLFDFPGKRYAFLILVTHKPPHGLSWTAFYLRYPKTNLRTSRDVEPECPPMTYKMECSIKGEPLTWSIFPENILMCDAIPEHFNWDEDDIILTPESGAQGTSPSSLFALINIRKMEAGTSAHQGRHLINPRSSLILTPFSMLPPSSAKEEGEVEPATSSTTDDFVATVVEKVPQLSLSAEKKGSCPYDKISEHLKCSICRKLSKSKIFQCKEGHLLCEECHPKYGNCVKCRTRLPFPSERIRALVVETLLDELTLECPYRKYGCTKTMNRKCLQDHIRVCCYNFTRFGPFVSICEGLGLEKCSFKMNRGNITESIRHLQEAHGAAINDTASLAIEFADFANFPGSSTKPLIFNRKEEGYAYLVLMTPDGVEGWLTWAVYYLRFPKPSHSSKMELALPPVPHQVECSLNGRYSLAWTPTPVDIFSSWINKACSDDSDGITMDPAGCFGSPLTSVMAMVKVNKVESQGKDRSRCARLTLNPYSMRITIHQESADQEALPVTEVEKDSGMEIVQLEKKHRCPTCKSEHDPTLSSCPSCDAINPKCIVEFRKDLKQFRLMPAPCLTFVSHCPSRTESQKLEPVTKKDPMLSADYSKEASGDCKNLQNSTSSQLMALNSSASFSTSPRFDFLGSATSLKNGIFEFGVVNQFNELKPIGPTVDSMPAHALTSSNSTSPSVIEFSDFSLPDESDSDIIAGPNKGVKSWKKKPTISIEFQGAPPMSVSASESPTTETVDFGNQVGAQSPSTSEDCCRSQFKRYLRSRRVVAIKNGSLNGINPTSALVSFSLKPNCNFNVQATCSMDPI